MYLKVIQSARTFYMEKKKKDHAVHVILKQENSLDKSESINVYFPTSILLEF